MGGKRYAEEFKIKAIKQISDRVYKVYRSCRAAGCDKQKSVRIVQILTFPMNRLSHTHY